MAIQTLTGVHLFGDGAPAAARAVRATPQPLQLSGTATVDTSPVVQTTTTGSGGTWSLQLLQGVTYDVKIERWGLQTITITTDAEKEFSTYLPENAWLGGTVLGAIPFETGEQVRFFTYLDTDGVYQLGWRVVA